MANKSVSNFTYGLVMRAGAQPPNNVKQFAIPGADYGYLSIINTSNNSIELYQETTTTSAPLNALVTVPANTSITVPIEKRREFTAIYADGGGSEDKKVSLIFSVENLGINGVLGAAADTTVSITGDSVGLARKAQLPAALTAAGSLKTAVAEPLPSGGNNIGKVDIVSMPTVNTASASAMTASPKTTQISVGTVAAPMRVGASDLANRKQIAMYNMGDQNVFIGDSSVTVGSGFPLVPGGAIAFDQNPSNTAPVYAVAAAAVTVAVMEVS